MKKLNPIEIRILGVLIEKESTTPDQYPLTLNSIILGSNQKSNRSPVTNFSESEVFEACESLMQKHYVIRHHEVGARTAKFLHQVKGTENCSNLKLQVLSSLFLKGFQTPGEILQKIKRSCPDIQLHEVNILLDEELKCESPWFKQLKKEPGKKESRWCHLWGDIDIQAVSESPESPQPLFEASAQPSNGIEQALKSEIDTLKSEVSALKNEVSELHKKFNELLN